MSAPPSAGVRSADSAARARVPVRLEELWRYYDELRSLSERIVGDPATADDVVQEAYLRALRHLDELDGELSVRAWMATVVRRCSVDELRRRGRRAVPVDVLPEPVTATRAEVLDGLMARETLERLRAALDLLAPRERRLLLDRVAEERSMVELAEADGASVRSVESVLLRARAKLSRALESNVPAAAIGRSARPVREVDT